MYFKIIILIFNFFFSFDRFNKINYSLNEDSILYIVFEWKSLQSLVPNQLRFDEFDSNMVCSIRHCFGFILSQFIFKCFSDDTKPKMDHDSYFKCNGKTTPEVRFVN